MLHTIVTWDCAYRNFHHLIDALMGQDFDRSEWELIYVEQRTKRRANAYNRALGLPSLWDCYNEVKDEINLHPIYLGDPPDEPYHLGRCVNAGLAKARGEIISVMDGDQLLQPHFLNALTAFHKGKEGVACLACHVASAPAGATEENWLEASFDFDELLALCPYGAKPYPEVTKPGSYGSMVSARQAHWEGIGGYDEHPIWSTSASMVNADAAHRLERLLEVEAELLRDTFSIHPWHPKGYGRSGRAKGDERVMAYLALQRELMDAARHYHWGLRTPKADALYAANRDLVDGVLEASTQALRETYEAAKGGGGGKGSR